MICLKHQQQYGKEEFCVYCGNPAEKTLITITGIPFALPILTKEECQKQCGDTCCTSNCCTEKEVEKVCEDICGSKCCAPAKA